MANISNEGLHEKVIPQAAVDASLISTTAAIIGMILAIIGLGGIRTYWMAGLASIAIGAAQLFEGEALGAKVSGLSEIGEAPLGDIGIGMMTGRLPGGIFGIILGILSVFAVAPAILLPLAGIIFGIVLILGTWVIVRLNDLYTAKFCLKEETRDVARAAVRSAETLQIFLGCGSVALGVLGLTGFEVARVILSMVALLGIGFSSLINSTIFSGRVLGSLHCEKVPVA